VLQQGGHKVGKNSQSFLGFSRAKKLLFHKLSQQKVTQGLSSTVIPYNVSNITGHSHTLTMAEVHRDHLHPVYPVNNCFTQIFE